MNRIMQIVNTCSQRKERSAFRGLALALMLIIIGVAGCRPKMEVPEASPLRMTPEQAYQSMEQNQFDFQWFAARFSGSVVWQGSNQNVAGSMRIQRDQAIYISIAPILGIEVARAIITPDSVKIINRLESSYYVGDVQILNQMFSADVDFYMLQALFTGNDFPHFEKTHFSLKQEQDLINLNHPSRGRINGKGSRYNHTLMVDPSTMRIKTNLLTEARQNRTLRADYDQFEKIDPWNIPTSVQIVFSDRNARAVMNLNYSRMTMNEPQRMQFSIPARYTPMDF